MANGIIEKDFKATYEKMTPTFWNYQPYNNMGLKNIPEITTQLQRRNYPCLRHIISLSSNHTERLSQICCKIMTSANCDSKYNNNNNNNNKNNNLGFSIPLVKTNKLISSHFKMSRYKNSWQLIVAIYYIVLYITTSVCLAARQEVLSNCTFPQHWEGSWFLSGYQQSIHIKDSQFSYRGKCIASDGNKYLMVDEKGCHRCLVIYEQHKNVLQYKESECDGDSMYMDQSNPAAMPMSSIIKSDHRGGAHPNLNGHSRLSSSDQYIMRSNDDINDCLVPCRGRETLTNLCDQIPGDALLYSLFRESAEPVKCPLRGPYTFTYNRGHGECSSPVSNIESCTEDSRLLLSFQACPDVHGTESTVEELTCLATWKDGNSRYLVGLVSHHHALSNEERFRCFVYEPYSHLMAMASERGLSGSANFKGAEYKLAQSGDATCNGLDSAEVGARIMTLRKPPPAERCDFPAWFKGPRHWHSLMGNAGYVFHPSDGSMHITKSNGLMETRALCEQINKQTPTQMMAVVRHTKGCQSGFMCMMFYRRDTHIAEIQTGTPATRLEDACALDYFDVNKIPYVTLLASNPEPQICPLEGLYTLRGAIGPPYIISRHKRNHSNKAHSIHSHHHHDQTHKIHRSLGIRNPEEFNQNSWYSGTRGLSLRNRRDIKINKPKKILTIIQNSNKSDINEKLIAKINETQRNRREIPGCVVNYQAQRQLWIGCTESNIIEVRPQCIEDGEEVYSCHGSWAENNTVYIIAKHEKAQHGVCISYHALSGNTVKLTVGDICIRQLNNIPEHHLVANVTIFGKCGDPSSSTGHEIANYLIFSCLIISLSMFIISTKR